MSLPVVTLVSGGLPVVDVTSTTKIGLPVTEAVNGRGLAVTKVTGKPGMAVVYATVADWPPSGTGAFGSEQRINPTVSENHPGGYTTGQKFTFLSAGQVVGVAVLSTTEIIAGETAGYIGTVWDETGATNFAQVTGPVAIGGVWTTLYFASPLVVSAGVIYMVTVSHPSYAHNTRTYNVVTTPASLASGDVTLTPAAGWNTWSAASYGAAVFPTLPVANYTACLSPVFRKAL